jgi:hypothetical protein
MLTGIPKFAVFIFKRVFHFTPTKTRPGVIKTLKGVKKIFEVYYRNSFLWLFEHLIDRTTGLILKWCIAT